MLKKYLLYYLNGFKLLNANLDLFFFGLLLNMSGYLSILGLHINAFIDLILVFIFIIYNTFMIVILLNNRIDKVKITYKYIYYLFIELLKRLFIWMVLIFILLVILVLVFGVVAVLFLGPGVKKENYIEIFKNQIIILLFVTSIIRPVLNYVPIFFGIKNCSFIDSIKKSIHFTIQNFKFTYLIIPLIIVFQGIGVYGFNALEKTSILQLGLAIISNYINLVIISSYLLYFKDAKIV